MIGFVDICSELTLEATADAAAVRIPVSTSPSIIWERRRTSTLTGYLLNSHKYDDHLSVSE